MSYDLDAIQQRASQTGLAYRSWHAAPQSCHGGHYEIQDCDDLGFYVADVADADAANHIAGMDPKTTLAIIADLRKLVAAAEVVILDAGDNAIGPHPDPNLAELAHYLAPYLTQKAATA